MDVNSIKVSVVVPVYNAESFLNRCITSIVNQSEKSLEIILVDDLSTDNSEAIIKSAQHIHPNIQYVKLKRKGHAGGARNLGMQLAKGRYISFIDCDDWLDSNMYTRSSIMLEKFDCDIAVCGVQTEFYSPFDSKHRYQYDFENIIESKMALELMCKRYNQDIAISPIMGNKLYRLDFLRRKQIKFIENCYYDDDTFNYIAFLNAGKVAITPNSYMHYYQQENSITHSFSKKHIDDLLAAFSILRKYLLQQEIYNEQIENYYSFFEKCLSFVLSVLSATEPSRKVQNEYLSYLFSQCRDVIMLAEYIEYLGLSRIRRAFNPNVML